MNTEMDVGLELVAAILSFYHTGGKTPERVYHTFVLGLLAHLTDRYNIRSNCSVSEFDGQGQIHPNIVCQDDDDR